MDNKAREQYLAQQPVAPMPQRVAAEPLPELTHTEITVIIVFAILVGYALYRIFRPNK
jgi:Na+/H+-dicarboxylate symporter